MDLSMFALTNKVALVTGAGSGIGKAIALAFSKAGASVVGADRVASTLEDTVAEIRKSGGKAIAAVADVQEPEQVANMLESIMAEFGRIDILVNNVGGTSFCPILDMSVGTWEADIRLNLTTTFVCSKIVGAVMMKQKQGNIINISSMSALGPWPNAAHYAAAKTGVISLTRTLSVELAPYVRVNAIAPGVIMTALTRKLAPENTPRRQEQLKRIPLQRFGKPEDIASVAVFLASEASSYITGETLPVTGGITTTVFGL